MTVALTHHCFAWLRMARRGGMALVFVVCAWTCAGGAWHAVRAESLTCYVPADAGLCIEFLDLSHDAATQVDREVLTRLAHFPPLLDPNLLSSIDRLRGFVARLAPRLQTSPERLWSQIFGTSVAVAVWSEDRGRAHLGQVVLLFECHDPALLQNVVRALVEPASQGKPHAPLPTADQFCILGATAGVSSSAHDPRNCRFRYGWASHPRHPKPPQSQTLTYRAPLPPKEYAGHVYHVRADAHRADAPALVAAAVGSVGIITGNERLLERTIDLVNSAAATPRAGEAGIQVPARLAELSSYRQSQARIPGDAGVRLFISPRAWDEAFRDAMQNAPGLVAGSLFSAWQALDYVALGITPGEVLSVDAWMHYRTAEFPPALAHLVESMAGPAEFLDRVPADAIVALAGRINLMHLSELLFPVDAALPDNGKPITQDIAQGLALGTRLFSDLLPQLGPDVGAFLARQPAGDRESGLPFAWVVGVQTPPQAATALDQRISAVMSLLGDLQRAEAAVPAAHPMQTDFQGVTLTSIADLAALPRGVEPTYAVTDGYAFAATCPDAIRRIIDPPAGSALAESPQFRRLLNPQLADPSHYFYLDCASLRQLLAEYPDELRALVTAFRGLPPETAARSLTQLRELLNLCDALLVSAKFEPDSLATSLRMAVDASRNTAPTSPATRPSP